MPTPDRFSDLRVLRWFDRIDDTLAGENRGPIRASLDLTNVCNHACSWCEPLAYREDTMRDRNHTLQSEVALEVLADLAAMDTKTVNFSGGGEPTCHPAFGTILARATSLHLRTWIVTNGQLMDRWMEQLRLADHIRISLDASSAVEHKRMHASHGGDYPKICENIVELCKKRINGSPEVGIAYVLADCNDKCESLRRVYEFACKAGVDFIHFRPLSEETPGMASFFPLSTLAWCEENLKGPTKVYALGKRERQVFEQRDFSTCYAALTNAVIGANGDVQACCDRRDISFGNVNQQSFKSIWLSARHRAKAEAIVPKLCTRCLMCGYNRAVEKFIVNNEALPELV